jgi:hypothetical protein
MNFKAACQFMFASSLTALVLSCHNAAEKKEPPQHSADMPAIGAAPPPAVFEPFDVMEVSHTVKDYAAWRPAFDSDSVARNEGALEFLAMGRNMDNANDVLIVLKVSDVQKAKNFAGSPALKNVMEKAGVISKPDIKLFRVIRFEPDAKEKQWVTVTHRVKNFDAWLKVFDGEGKAARAEQGLLDVALCQGIDDPNIVHLVFDIQQANLAKAKAAITSEEKKRLMKTAGVDGAPKIRFYNSAE